MEQTPDGPLVRGAIDGNRDAAVALFRRHLLSVHDLAARLVHEEADAADVTLNTFVRAFSRLDACPDPDRFGGWLHGFAFQEAVTRLRSRREAWDDPTAPSTSRPELARVAATEPDTDETRPVPTAARLVWAAASSLDERTLFLIDLDVRKGAEREDVAVALDTTPPQAARSVVRAVRRARDVMTATLLAHEGAPRCDDLAAIVAGREVPPVSERLGAAVTGHAADCVRCQETLSAVGDPLAVYAALAPVRVPDGLHDRVWSEIDDRWTVATAARARGSRLSRWLAAVLVLVGLVGVVLLSVTGQLDDFGGNAGTDAQEPGDVGEDGIAGPGSVVGTDGGADSGSGSGGMGTGPGSGDASAPGGAGEGDPDAGLAGTGGSEAPTISILEPEDGFVAVAEDTGGGNWAAHIDAVAEANDGDGQQLEGRWYSDRETNDLGRTARVDFWLRLPGGCPGDPATHLVTVEVTDPDGNTARDSISIEVVCP